MIIIYHVYFYLQPDVSTIDPAEDNLPSGAATPTAARPRTSGSMVAHGHDDLVTRMKNIEMIELGRNRIRPWYFAPYPQVNKVYFYYLLANNTE